MEKRQKLEIITRTYNNDGFIELQKKDKYKDIYFKNNSFLGGVVTINGVITLNQGDQFSISADQDFFSGDTFYIQFANQDSSNSLLVVLTRYDIND
jgi:hypothetical protein